MTDRNITIYTFFQELKNALEAGWIELKKSNSYQIYTEAFDFFKQVGLYEGLFRPFIPNPVYDNAAKELGKFFLETALQKGLYFKELFPGDFSISTEEEKNDAEYRIFYLTTFYNQKTLGIYRLVFEHNHDHFDFPTPPTLEVFSSENYENRG